jgi:DNA primase
VTGNLTYVQARALDPERTGRKYDNPAAVLAPNPRLAFPADPGTTYGGVLVVCEGLPDALIAAQAGYRTVALLGASTPDASVAARLANHAANLDVDLAVVCDPDAAGRHVAAALTGLLAAHAIHPTVITPPDGVDLNNWALTDPTWAATLDRRLAAGPVATIDTGVDL